jgi:hypothetical protein
MSIVDHMSRDQLLQMQASARTYQERYDTALAPWDQRAPAPVLGQDIDTYRRETLVKMKKLLPEDHKLRIPVRKMPNDVLDVFDPQICKAVHDAANDPYTVPPGQMRAVPKVNQGGTRVVEYVGALREDNPRLGQRSFIEDFKGPAFRARIRNPDTHPGWFTGNARAAPAPIGYDQSGWQSAYRNFQVSQGYLG